VTEGLPNAASLADDGEHAFREGRLDEADEAFAAAERLFREAGEQGRAAQMANNRCVALLQAGKPLLALEAVKGTPEVFAAAGETRLRAQALGNLAAALEASGSPADAEARYREALALFEQTSDPENRRYTLQALSRLQLRRGRPLEAALTMQDALAEGKTRGLRSRLSRWLSRKAGRLLGGE
jgi:tetratricopeptide (TPR) repeat protein